MEITCLDNVEFLLTVFPLLATILASAGGNTLTVEHSIWETDFGPMIVAETPDHWLARYPDYEGVIVGQVRPGMVNGLWIQPRSDKRCAEQASLVESQAGSFLDELEAMEIPLPAHHWGSFKARFAGDAFTGDWDYCAAAQQTGQWKGVRLCSTSFELRSN